MSELSSSLAITQTSTKERLTTMDEIDGRKYETTEGGEDDVLGEGTGHREDRPRVESALELRDADGPWTRAWCVLTDSRLRVYSTERDTEPADVTSIAGYDVTELIDQFPGKRFVLRLEHKSKPDLMLSLDSREDLALWKHGISESIRNILRDESSVELPAQTITATGHRATEVAAGSQSDGCGEDGLLSQTRPGGSAQSVKQPLPPTSPGSAQSVKQRLLAEMLRQRLELERMQAMRAEMRAGHQAQTSDALAADEDRVVALTRLKQRRMSTQIKLQTIQREMEASQGLSPRDKRSTFLALGRKRMPDLLLQTQTAHDGAAREHGDGRTALEAQVKSLSSRLQNLDQNISTHEAIGSSSPLGEDASSSVTLRRPAVSPALAVSNYQLLRHSLDPSYLSPIPLEQDASLTLRDSVFAAEDDEDIITQAGIGRHISQTSSGDVSLETGTNSKSVSKGSNSKGKEPSPTSATSKSTSGGFKSSVQKLAHRTFSRAAHWNWTNKKSSSASSTSPSSPPGLSKDTVHNDNNNTIPLSFSSGQLSDLAPDITDMTAKSSRPSHRIITTSSANLSGNFPQAFLDDNAIIRSMKISEPTSGQPFSRTLPQEWTSTVAEEQNNKKLAEILKSAKPVTMSSPISSADRFSSRLQGFSSSSPNLALVDNVEFLSTSRKHLRLRVSQEHDFPTRPGSAETHARPSSLGFTANGHVTGRVISSSASTAASSRSPAARSSGVPVTPRREVNPNTLAQIEAFEELSLKYLGAATK